MRKESQTRKGLLVSKLQKLECSVVAAISSQKNDASAREACLTKVVEELISQGVIRIEIERDESFEKRDKALIKNVLDAQNPHSMSPTGTYLAQKNPCCGLLILQPGRYKLASQ